MTHRPDPLRIEITQPNSHPVIRVAGGVDAETAPLFEAAIAAIVDASPTRVEIDLSRSTKLNSQGMATITAARRRLAGHGATLSITGGQEAIIAGCEAMSSEDA